VRLLRIDHPPSSTSNTKPFPTMEEYINRQVSAITRSFTADMMSVWENGERSFVVVAILRLPTMAPTLVDHMLIYS
jgi:hypothetical protein